MTRTQDTYVTNADSGDHSLGAFLHVGTSDNGVTKYRSLLQFDVSKLAGATIESASLRLYNSYTGACGGWRMYADPINKAWTASTATWAGRHRGRPALLGRALFHPRQRGAVGGG